MGHRRGSRRRRPTSIQSDRQTLRRSTRHPAEDRLTTPSVERRSMSWLAVIPRFVVYRAGSAVIRHVCPGNRGLGTCRPCPRVIIRARSRLPVSYPRCVVCSLNGRQFRWGQARDPARTIRLAGRHRRAGGGPVDDSEFVCEVVNHECLPRVAHPVAGRDERCQDTTREHRRLPIADVVPHVLLGEDSLGSARRWPDRATATPCSCNSSAMSALSRCRAALATEQGRYTRHRCGRSCRPAAPAPSPSARRRSRPASRQARADRARSALRSSTRSPRGSASRDD